MTNMRHGGRVLAEQLRLQGCERVFCVPGESYLAALDGLHDIESIHTIVCRQEGGAAMMADAYGKLTGKPGVCFVTRGPGATNAAAGVHIAWQDSTPMLLLIGQVARGTLDREAFQEIDYRRMFGQMAKWVAQVDDPERIPEYLSHAYHLATSGRPGPVVLAFPEDVLAADVAVEDAKPAVAVTAKAAPEDVAEFECMVREARKPLMIVGGGGWSAQASKSIEQFATTNNMPVAVSFRCQDYFDNAHPNYAGHVGVGIAPSLAQRVKDCDLLVSIGARLGEATTRNYDMVDIPNPQMRLIHVYPGPDELGRVYRPDLAINASSPSFATAIADLKIAEADQWQGWSKSVADDFRDSLKMPGCPGELKLEDIVAYLSERLDPDAIICNGAGNYTVWVHRYFRYRPFRSQLAPTSGSMGYGVPAAVAAKLTDPGRQAVCFAGDGCFMMHCQELATAVQYKVNPIFIVVNNGMFGTIRMHQEKTYPGRVYATGLHNPDFAALARSYGAHGVRVASQSEFVEAFEACQGMDVPAVIEAIVDPEALHPDATLTQVRKQGESS